MSPGLSTRSVINRFVRTSGTDDPFDAIRRKARAAIDSYRSAFGEVEAPLDLDTLLSFLGIAMSDAPPAHSQDAELVPMGSGRVAIRVNQNQPETRRRFSIGHEISHTFFPGYQTKEWCRTDGRYRNRDNPDDLIEMLCDAGAAELLMPTPWFTEDASCVRVAKDLVQLADRYIASREATLRRFAEMHPRVVAAVFLSWKLKPTEKRAFSTSDRPRMLLRKSDDLIRARKLRVDYSIPSIAFAGAGYYIPPDKSVPNAGPLYEAATRALPCEGECALDLGAMRGRFSVLAIPVWTEDSERGPNGEVGVGAIIETVTGQRPVS